MVRTQFGQKNVWSKSDAIRPPHEVESRSRSESKRDAVRPQEEAASVAGKDTSQTQGADETGNRSVAIPAWEFVSENAREDRPQVGVEQEEKGEAFEAVGLGEYGSE